MASRALTHLACRDQDRSAELEDPGSDDVGPVADHNAAAVDLFGTRHALKVLSAFGRAYDDLPEAMKRSVWSVSM